VTTEPHAKFAASPPCSAEIQLGVLPTIEAEDADLDIGTAEFRYPMFAGG
jgi:hypothetical protein